MPLVDRLLQRVGAKKVPRYDWKQQASLVVPAVADSPSPVANKHRDTLTRFDLSLDISDISQTAVGYGGIADVYKASLSDGNGGMTRVALKVIRVGPQVSGKILRRHRHEIELWLQLSCPYILRLIGLYWGISPLPAMVSPWCDFGDINNYLLSKRRNEEFATIKHTLLQQVLAGMTYLHTHKPVIVHGDLKGANVLVSNKGVVQICDFGFSKMLAEDAVSFQTHTSLKGTFRWMSPELLLDEDAHLTTYSDMWAFGCLCIEVESGRPPYAEIINERALIVAISQYRLPQRPKATPEWLWSIMMCCFAINPSSRATAPYLLKAFKELRISGPLLFAAELDNFPLLALTAKLILDVLLRGAGLPPPELQPPSDLIDEGVLTKETWLSLRSGNHLHGLSFLVALAAYGYVSPPPPPPLYRHLTDCSRLHALVIALISEHWGDRELDEMWDAALRNDESVEYGRIQPLYDELGPMIIPTRRTSWGTRPVGPDWNWRLQYGFSRIPQGVVPAHLVNELSDDITLLELPEGNEWTTPAESPTETLSVELPSPAKEP
ncbi:kinase-like protein [Exidia glandulosa HHB12029]|uniref:Kinase-like protein n=1 Tax=Exidia glandulosa HHB12029 TaxID=1314781 RepID=A0A165NQG1_EXIGL|nr:kinase-like protein [Exidia glandulosa HHB12029]